MQLTFKSITYTVSYMRANQLPDERKSVLLQFLLKRKIVVGLFVFLTFGLGLYSFTKLDRELLPSITFNQALVVVSTKEMPTEDVEEAVTKPIEQMLESMEGVEEYMSPMTMNDSI